VRTRTSVLTLVVVAPRPEDVQRAMAVVAMLAAQHPSRAIVLSPADPDGPAAFEAHVYASCQLPERSSSEVCTEEILIKVGGELSRHLASTVAPLLIHDLPVVLWWPDDVPFGRPDFSELADECDRLFVDSGHFRGNGLERLVALADAVRGGLVVHDVSWMRLMLWRELLASCFDHPLLIRELKHLSSIRVDVARPGAEVPFPSQALRGWLMARLRSGNRCPVRAPRAGPARRAAPARSARLRSGRRVFHPPVESRRCRPRGRVHGAGGAGSRVRGPRERHLPADHLLAGLSNASGPAGPPGWSISTRPPTWPIRSTVPATSGSSARPWRRPWRSLGVSAGHDGGQHDRDRLQRWARHRGAGAGPARRRPAHGHPAARRGAPGTHRGLVGRATVRPAVHRCAGAARGLDEGTRVAG
jgi:glucose-6-phosphate dehydrogenase assembly protein OpcA